MIGPAITPQGRLDLLMYKYLLEWWLHPQYLPKGSQSFNPVKHIQVVVIQPLVLPGNDWAVSRGAAGTSINGSDPGSQKLFSSDRFPSAISPTVDRIR